MKWAFLLIGMVLGFFGGVGSLIFLRESNKDAGEMSIVFADKSYYETDVIVMVSGTLTGKGMGYPNNTYAFSCLKDSKECWISSVQAIGDKQIGRMDAPYAYGITKWSPLEVIAVYDGSFACAKTTITIQRKSQELFWVEEPVNQEKPHCKNAEPAIRKYSLESSPGWKKIIGDKKS